MTTGLETLLLRHGIGFNSLNQFFQNQARQTGFPPYDIEERTVEDKNTQFRITLAVAGFVKDDITIEHTRDVLRIVGKKNTSRPENFDGSTFGEFLHQGIAFRDFVREFRLGEHVEVMSADLTDGMLVIILEKKLPLSLAAKKIEIGVQKNHEYTTIK